MTRLTRPEIMRRLVRALVALAVCLAFGSDTDSGRTYTSSHATLRSGGGSVIIARGEAKKQGSDITVPTDLHATKGGSYIIGRKLDGEWEPGELIERPAAFSEAKHTFIQLGNGRTLKLSYSAMSEQGRTPRPPNKANQDSYVCMERLGNNPKLMLFGVFDGHGPKGEDASNFCRLNLPDIAVQRREFALTPLDAVANSFEPLHSRFIGPDVTQRVGVNTSVSGTTAIVVAISGTEWLCANVGDSRAMMGSLSPKGNDLFARPLSVDHKPQRPDENARISRTEARILSETALGIEGGSEDKLYVCRIHNGTIRYGVLFTRSIGDADAHANLGLSCKPEIKRGMLGESDRFLVIATDGVWDYMDEADVARAVDDAGDDAHLAVQSVVAEAKRRWDNSSDRRRDDITAVVIMTRFVTSAEAAASEAPENSMVQSPSVSTPVSATSASSSVASAPPILQSTPSATVADQAFPAVPRAVGAADVTADASAALSRSSSSASAAPTPAAAAAAVVVAGAPAATEAAFSSSEVKVDSSNSLLGASMPNLPGSVNSPAHISAAAAKAADTGGGAHPDHAGIGSPSFSTEESSSVPSSAADAVATADGSDGASSGDADPSSSAGSKTSDAVGGGQGTQRTAIDTPPVVLVDARDAVFSDTDASGAAASDLSTTTSTTAISVTGAASQR